MADQLPSAGKKETTWPRKKRAPNYVVFILFAKT
jgi:hypothetical protein